MNSSIQWTGDKIHIENIENRAQSTCVCVCVTRECHGDWLMNVSAVWCLVRLWYSVSFANLNLCSKFFGCLDWLLTFGAGIIRTCDIPGEQIQRLVIIYGCVCGCFWVAYPPGGKLCKDRCFSFTFVFPLEKIDAIWFQESTYAAWIICQDYWLAWHKFDVRFRW